VQADEIGKKASFEEVMAWKPQDGGLIV